MDRSGSVSRKTGARFKVNAGFVSGLHAGCRKPAPVCVFGLGGFPWGLGWETLTGTSGCLVVQHRRAEGPEVFTQHRKAIAGSPGLLGVSLSLSRCLPLLKLDGKP